MLNSHHKNACSLFAFIFELTKSLESSYKKMYLLRWTFAIGCCRVIFYLSFSFNFHSTKCVLCVCVWPVSTFFSFLFLLSFRCICWIGVEPIQIFIWNSLHCSARNVLFLGFVRFIRSKVTNRHWLAEFLLMITFKKHINLTALLIFSLTLTLLSIQKTKKPYFLEE